MVRFQTWLTTVNRLDLLEKGPLFCYVNRRICNLHFDDSMFTDCFKNKLKRNATPKAMSPSENSITNSPSYSNDAQTENTSSIGSVIDYYEAGPSTVDVSSQTTSVLSCKKKLRSQIAKMSSYRSSLINKEEITSTQFFKYCQTHFRPMFCEIIKAQHALKDAQPGGERYTAAFKQFALGLYFLSPLAYRSLSLIMHLPPKTTLLNMTKKWAIEVGLSNKFVFQALHFRAEKMQEKEKDCIICVDGMPIKRFLYYHRTKDTIVGFHHSLNGNVDIVANSALIFMARGVYSNWKQPIVYFFVANSCPVEDLKEIIDAVILNMYTCGFKVRGIVSDQGANFSKLHKQLGVTVDKPYFYVSNYKIFYMFDVPHLLKYTRNNFFQHTFKYKEKEIRKDYLEMLYKYDQGKSRKFAPKLTDIHMNPKNFDKMDVKLAAQVFSHTVVTGMESLIALNVLPEQSMFTIQFVSLMDKLFDVLNSRSNYAKKSLNRLFRKTEEQMAVIEEAKEFFGGLEVIDIDNKSITNQMKFIYGWLVTIAAFLGLFDDLRYPQICSRRLNRDCLENLNRKIRQQLPNCKNATAIQFQRAFKKIFCLSYIDFNLDCQSNCIPDDDNVLMNFQEADIEKMKPFVENQTQNVSILTEDYDYVSLELPEQNVHEYISGYFLHKCLKVHNCATCENFARSKQTVTDSRTLIGFKPYESGEDSEHGMFNGLCVPPQTFCKYVYKLDKKFDSLFGLFAQADCVGFKIKSELKYIHFFHPCINFPIDYFLSLYVRFRIFNSLKIINRKLKDPDNKKRNLKTLMIL